VNLKAAEARTEFSLPGLLEANRESTLNRLSTFHNAAEGSKLPSAIMRLDDAGMAAQRL